MEQRNDITETTAPKSELKIEEADVLRKAKAVIDGKV
jgi:hypothetical protein